MNPEARVWQTIYPTYINSNRTENQGRRLPKAKCVPDPRWQEIRDVLEATKDFQILVEHSKLYPREVDKEQPTAHGRIKYQTRDPKFASKRNVLIYLGEMIPKLKSRAKAASSSTSEQAQQQATGKGSKKPKGGRK
ncbi:Signal recognition particle 19 kDa protein [Halotydeus destructor]|nr:Signal recognition particle 19 kDa protein [Halotydeus destructor]